MLAVYGFEPTRTEWESLFVVVPNADGKLRFSVDYLKLHAMNECDSYPITPMHKFIDFLSCATILSTLGANSGYWQLEIAKDDWYMTEFTIQNGLFRFKQMPIELKHSWEASQQVMNVLLTKVN